jgi:hypothetical protein
MLMYWSDRMRGGILDALFGLLDGAVADLTCALKDSTRISGSGPLDSQTVRANASGKSILYSTKLEWKEDSLRTDQGGCA